MADTTPAYSLLPWVRRGIASQVAGTSAVNYATVPLSLAVNNAAVPAPPHVRLPGPGDVKSIDARAFIRTEPRDGVDSFEPNYLAAVELATPDLPWMLTPSGNNGDRLQPWICLIVLPVSDAVSLVQQAGGPAILRLDQPLDLAVELPDLTQIDAWAHAQIAGSDLSTAALNGDSGATLSRLIAPRKLQASTSYIACVVPTYRAGVNAGLGLDVTDSDLALAWDKTTKAPFSLPVYFHFRFQTGPAGDFASLARRIGPPSVPIVAGTRTMDISQPGFGAADAPGVTLGLEGALKTFNMPSTPWPDGAQAPYETQLRQVLSPPVAADPVVTPPVFGSTQTGQDLPAADGQPPVWMGELNLDPRSRTVASAGGQVVQTDADAMVASAWDQLGEIRKANQLLRQAQFAREVTASMNQRHLQKVNGDGNYLQITSPVHRRVSLTMSGVSSTLLGHVEASRVPLGAVSAAMRRLSRPRGPLGRRLAVSGPQRIVDRLNIPPASSTGVPPTSTGGMVVAGPVKPPVGMVTLNAVAPNIQMAKMSPVVLKQAPGWQKLASTTTSTVGNAGATGAVGSTGTTTTTVGTTGGAEIGKGVAGIGTLHANLAINSGAGHGPVVANAPPVNAPPVKEPPGSAPPANAPPVNPPPAQIVNINWQIDPNVPAILQGAVKTVPPPIVFPTTTAALAQMQNDFRGAATAITTYLNVAEPVAVDPPSLGGTPALSSTRSLLDARLNPATTIKARVGARVPLNTGPDPLQPLTAAPKFPQAMYEPLAELSPEWMLPGIASVTPNTAILLQPNPGFVEAYLVGLNEEFARELLWRQFPAERRETWFQNFWSAGGTPDVPAIAQFDPNGHLGDHTQDHANPGRVALLVRADIFQRYPNALFSAAPAVWNADKVTRSLGTTRQFPLFEGHIGTDFRFFGFDIPDPFGNPDPNAGDAGYYFVLEEHITEPRFGLEPTRVAAVSGSNPTWNDLSWDDVAPGNFLNATTPPAFNADEAVTWHENSAAMAFILMRRPVRVAMHANALLAGGHA